ncbi:MAG: phytoene desaturase family protein [Acidimicrobiales bacterium]
MSETVDSVVIGGGHNGLVAANQLADAGWDVVVLEAAAEPGGAVRDAEVTAPGYHSDLFSAFFPMAAASPVIAGLGLEDHGLVWTHAPRVLAHLRPSQPAVLLHREVEATASGLEGDAKGDGEAWRDLHSMWERMGPDMMAALLGPMPPLRATARLALKARMELIELARLAILPVRRLAAERFTGEGPALLLAGNALHADVTPDAAPSALLGWMLVGLAQTVGFPVPVGGSGRITDALTARLLRAGGEVRCATRVERVDVVDGRATGVVVGGQQITARRAVIAACDAQLLYDRLVGVDKLPAAYAAGLRRFQRASSTVKVNWAVDGLVPWRDPSVAGAGTVHLADSLDELTMTSAQLSIGQVPADPFLLIGQMTTTDSVRSPAGTESLWAYTHVPQDVRGDAGGELRGTGVLRGDDLRRFVDRIEARVEAHAPGFASMVVGRQVQGPDDLEAENPSLIGGDLSGGTAQLHQQLIFRPVPGFARPETPIAGLFLGSASAHPGGSVHGACGANAARAAILHDRLARGRQAARRLTARAGGVRH